MSMLGGMLGQEGGGGGSSGGPLAQLMTSVVNNPSLQRMAEDPQIRNMVDSVIGDASQPQDIGSLMNRVLPQMVPMMGQLFGGGSGNTGQAQAPVDDGVLDQQLSPSEASRWREIMSRDGDAMVRASDPPAGGVSEVYAAGESAGKSGGLMGLVDSIGEGGQGEASDKDQEGDRSDMYV